MYSLTFSDPNQGFDTCILIKESALRQSDLERAYLSKLPDSWKVCAMSLDYAGKAKPNKTIMEDYLGKLLPVLQRMNIQRVIVADGEYFKRMTGLKKTTGAKGYVYDYAGMDAVYVPAPGALFYNPELKNDIDLSLFALQDKSKGKYIELGSNVLHSEYYPDTLPLIASALDSLHQYDAITCDIEAFSLKHHDAGIGTIAFSWDEHNGLAFAVDYESCDEYLAEYWCRKDKKIKRRKAVGRCTPNRAVRRLLRNFFENYKGRIIWHNASYDAYVLVYQLFMEDLLDQEGLLYGLDVMCRTLEDSLLVTYLATNSTAGNKLSLKDQSHEFAGNYAESEINDIRAIPKGRLLRYNLVDTCATWYVMDKHYPTMVLDDQLSVYEDVFKPALVDIIQMQLTGMCLDMKKVLEAEIYLGDIHKEHLNALQNHPTIAAYVDRLRWKKVEEDNLTLKNKKRTYEEAAAKVNFNPNSNPQLQDILYDVLGLPVIEKTKTKLPATGKKVLKKLTKMIQDETALEILKHLIAFNEVDKVLTAFIPRFKEAPLASDGMHYLFGSFKLGGTVSGRLSSANPNLQQIPSGSTYAKVIKKCFVAPKGWVFCGADYASLEDRIDAKLTKDPNKIKVYTDGYDGHCMRAYAYFKEEMPDIVDTVESINSIQELYPVQRQDSKAPTFALTYQGTWMTMVKNLGWSEQKSKMVENNYLDLYKVSIEYKKKRIHQCTIDGYATVAFGLRVRTPLLAQVILGTSKTPHEAEAEGRTVGNAFGQSYGLLNSYAASKVMRQVRASKFKYDIKLCALIHDASYFYVRDNLEAIEFLNRILGEAMAWQDLPEINDEDVPLSGELDIFYPNWSESFTLPNNASVSQIKELAVKASNKRKEKNV